MLVKIIEINNIRGIINAAVSSYGVALVPKYAVVNELHKHILVQLFPQIKIPSDSFCIYFKKYNNSIKINKIINYLTNTNYNKFGFFDKI